MNESMFLGWDTYQWDIARKWFNKKHHLSHIPDTPEREHDFYAKMIAGVQSCKRAWYIQKTWQLARGKDPVHADRYFDV